MSKQPAPQTGKNLYQTIHDEFEYQIRTALARGKSAQKFHDGKLNNAETVAAIEYATKSILEAVNASVPANASAA